MNPLRRWFVLFLLGSACSGGQERGSTTPQQSLEDSENADQDHAESTAVPTPTPDLLLRYEGRYELISADRDTNECPVGLSVGVSELIISSSPPRLHTVGEDRDYDVRVDGDAIIAEARFPSEIGADHACPDSTIFERWHLALQEDNSLSGVHIGVWLFPPHCTRPCTVTFNVVTGPQGVTGLSDTI